MLRRRDGRSLSEPRSERKKRLHTSLTALTEAALSGTGDVGAATNRLEPAHVAATCA